MKRIFLIPAFLFLTSVVYAQSIQLSTYYPSPFGKYDRIQLVPRPTLLAGACDAGAQGTLYIDENSDQVMLCDAANWVPLVASGSWTEISPDLYATNTSATVGIGTTNPTSRLHVTAPEGDGPPGVFLENTDITASGGTDGVFGLRNTNTGTTPMISIGGPGNGTEVMVVDTQNKRVGIGTITPNNRIQVTDLINFDNAKFGTALGYQAGKVNTGNYNTFLGYQSGLANTSGGGNTFVGVSAGDTNTIGTWNVFIGQGSGQSNFLGSYNTFLGTESGFNATGGNNTFLGYRAGLSTTTGSDNILIGYNINAPTATTSNFLNIGNAIYGNLSTANVGIGTTAPQAKFHVDVNNDTSGSSNLGDDFIVGAEGGVGIGTTPLGGAGGAALYIKEGPTERLAKIVLQRSSTAKYLGIDFRRETGATEWSLMPSIEGGGSPSSFEIWEGGSFRRFVIKNATGNVGIGTADPGTNKLEVAGGPIKATGGLIIETRTTNPVSPVTGQMWLCTDTGDATPCNGI